MMNSSLIRPVDSGNSSGPPAVRKRRSRKLASNSKRASRKLLFRGMQSANLRPFWAKYRSLGAFDYAALLFYLHVTSNR